MGGRQENREGEGTFLSTQNVAYPLWHEKMPPTRLSTFLVPAFLYPLWVFVCFLLFVHSPGFAPHHPLCFCDLPCPPICLFTSFPLPASNTTSPHNTKPHSLEPCALRSLFLLCLFPRSATAPLGPLSTLLPLWVFLDSFKTSISCHQLIFPYTYLTAFPGLKVITRSGRSFAPTAAFPSIHVIRYSANVYWEMTI